MAVAVFDYSKWAAMFPYLAEGGVTDPIGSAFWDVAGLFFANDDCSPIDDLDKRSVYLNYIVAHLARLAGYPMACGAGGSAVPDGMVGRITSATEGTVSITSSWAASVSNSEAYWIQSPEGSTFWMLTRSFRTMQYIAPPPRYFGSARRGLVGGIWRP